MEDRLKYAISIKDSFIFFFRGSKTQRIRFKFFVRRVWAIKRFWTLELSISEPYYLSKASSCLGNNLPDIRLPCLFGIRLSVLNRNVIHFEQYVRFYNMHASRNLHFKIRKQFCTSLTFCVVSEILAGVISFIFFDLSRNQRNHCRKQFLYG